MIESHVYNKWWRFHSSKIFHLRVGKFSNVYLSGPSPSKTNLIVISKHETVRTITVHVQYSCIYISYNKRHCNNYDQYLRLWRKRDSSTWTTTPAPPRTMGGSGCSRVEQTSRSHWYMSMATFSVISALSSQSLTGYCLAHQYITIIWSGRRDSLKKLPSLIDLVTLHSGQYQHTLSVTSCRVLSRMAVAHLTIQYSF